MTNEFDSFFVGDGSASLMEDYREQALQTSQIVDEGDVGDLLDVCDDIADYAMDEIQLTSREDIDWAFHAYKKEVYDLFDWVSVKSHQMAGVPIKLEDLVLDDADKYLIDYLAKDVSNLYTWKCLAKVQACINLGVRYVRVFHAHDCPLCNSLSGTIYPSESLLKSICQGTTLSHPGAPIDVIPAIYRESYQGPLAGRLDLALVNQGHKDVLNVPRELMCYESFESVIASVKFLDVDFVNMPAWCKDNSVAESQGTVVYAEDETLYVHNSYVGNYGPLDYINEFIASNAVPDRLTDAERIAAVVYWLDGREVLKYEGNYYTSDTCERL